MFLLIFTSKLGTIALKQHREHTGLPRWGGGGQRGQFAPGPRLVGAPKARWEQKIILTKRPRESFEADFCNDVDTLDQQMVKLI